MRVQGRSRVPPGRMRQRWRRRREEGVRLLRTSSSSALCVQTVRACHCSIRVRRPASPCPPGTGTCSLAADNLVFSDNHRNPQVNPRPDPFTILPSQRARAGSVCPGLASCAPLPLHTAPVPASSVVPVSFTSGAAQVKAAHSVLPS